MGRPPLEIDADLVEKLASIHCTMKEIAAVAGCSVDTLERRFAEVIKNGQEKGKTSLRRYQWKAAEKGNVSMLIWLGKQILGQRDKSKEEIQDAINSNPMNQKLESLLEAVKGNKKEEI